MGMRKEAPYISDPIKKESNDERSKDCVSCDKVFKDKSYLKLHMKRMHLKIKDHFCDNCDKSFSTKSQLNTHLPTHTDNNFPCYMCGVKLSRKINLINHMKSLHAKSVEKPKIKQAMSEKLPCDICGKLFNSNKTLKKHVRNHDDVKPEKEEKTQKRFSNSFKLEVLEKVKDVGVQGARKAFGIHENTIKG